MIFRNSNQCHFLSVGEKWMRDKRTPKDVCGEATGVPNLRKGLWLLFINEAFRQYNCLGVFWK